MCCFGYFKAHTQMIPVLLLLSFVGFLLNLDTPKGVSYASPFLLFSDYCMVLLCSWFLINRILRRYGRKIIIRYYCLFLLSITIGLYILYFVWTPMIDPNADMGYDPLKYYAFASRIMRGDFIPWTLNYWGVVYFYIGCMTVFGLDPMVPLFVNSLLSLSAILLLARLLANNKTIAFYGLILLVPEVIYYQMVSSREVLCMAPVVIFIVKFLEFKIHKSKGALLLMLASFLLLTIIRPPMTVPLVLVVIISILRNAKGKNLVAGVIGLCVLGVIVLYGLRVSSSLGSSFDTTYLEETVTTGVSGNSEIAKGNSGGGLTTLLLPHNPVEYVVFGVIRSFVYLLPPPVMLTDFFEQMSLTNYFIYEHLTSILIMFLVPLVYTSFKNRKQMDNNHKLILMVYLLYFFMIGVSLPSLIQHRYRFIYEVFYFALAIYAYSNKKKLTKKIA